MKPRYNILIAALVLMLSSHFTFSQDDGIREKILELKLDKLTKKLELDETTKSTFMDKYKTFAAEFRQLNQKRAKTYKLMTDNIESGDGLDTLVNQVIENEKEIFRKKEEFVNEMKSMLNPKQIAKMIVFERKFNNEVKRIMKQFQKEGKRDRIFRDD
jgi:hypothetical protein